jgi:hypothetical protein
VGVGAMDNGWASGLKDAGTRQLLVNDNKPMRRDCTIPYHIIPYNYIISLACTEQKMSAMSTCLITRDTSR